MIIIDNFSQVTAQIETERGISKEALAEAVEQALISACKKKYSEEYELEATLNPITGEATIWRIRTVVKTIEEEEADSQITLKDAKTIEKDAKVGDLIKEEMDLTNFGRLAAQTAKQVIIQRIREAEKTSVFDEFTEKKGTIITGTIQKVEPRSYLINLGRIEAFLPPHEQIPGESYQVNDKIRVFVVDIDQTAKGPQIRVSRSHADLLKKLFELEVPEIADSIIEIVSVSREPGKRAKVAVKSNNSSIGAVGTCVGHMGSRIQSIIKEIGNEKIDILEWSEDPRQFIGNSLKPAKITHVAITNEENKEALVVVPKDELSLAIGKQGINVRLAVRLTGWKLDIMSDEEYEEKKGTIDEKAGTSFVNKIQDDLAAQQKEEADAKPKTKKAPKVEKALSEDVTVTVAQLAKQYTMKTVELMEKAKSFNIEIKSNRSKLTPEQVAEIRAKLG
ncbi:transcription termination/antitermination protein NusA [bacterium]|jgi:transcription termination/antitermination protein NusA|nr:transcription termination/antitermination protein NusA [bacterium]